MESRGHVQIHEACVVPFLLTSAGVKFCLVNPVSDNRWEFPKISLAQENLPLEALLDRVAAQVGLRGHLQYDAPLGYFEASRGDESRSMIGYLMQVDEFDDVWPQQSNYRRLWCLAEEARVRIRRKPLRRFIDLALHSHHLDRRAYANGSGNGNGNGSHPTSLRNV